MHPKVRMALKVLVGLVLIILLAMVVERFVFGDRHIKFSQKSLAKDNCRSDPNPEFKGAFTDLAKVLFIYPLGSTQVSSVGSSYVAIKDNETAPIYNPTDAVLETIVYAGKPGSDKAGEYALYFRSSCEITYVFDHLDKVSGKIKSLAPKQPAETAQKEKGTQPKVFIRQGELLGYTENVPEGSAFSFGLLNTSKPVDHLNPNRWKQEQANFAQCPYEYFDTRNDNNLRRYYIGKLLIVNENIVAKVFNLDQVSKHAQCGNLAHDIAGTASGGWFKGEGTDIKGDYLSVNKDLSTTQISIRRDGQLKDVLTDYSPDLFPEEVKTGQAKCYHDQRQNKWAFVRVMSATQLAIAQGGGNCPAAFPVNVSDVWKR